MGQQTHLDEKKTVRLVVNVSNSSKITKEFLLAELSGQGILGKIDEGDWEVTALGGDEAEILVKYRED